jgi:PAS domain-containing protein
MCTIQVSEPRFDANKKLLKSTSICRRLGANLPALVAAQDPYLIFGVDKIIECNDAAVEILGYDSKAEVVERPLDDINPPFQADGRSSKEHVNSPEVVDCLAITLIDVQKSLAYAYLLSSTEPFQSFALREW